MYLLDTNVLSEVVKRRPDPAVIDWLARLGPGQASTSATVLAELLFGAHRHPDPAKRLQLQQAIEEDLLGLVDRRVHAFDEGAARVYAKLLVGTKNRNRSVEDLQIAAVALVRNLTLVTRNTRDFEGLGLTLLNPWEPVT